MTSLALVNGYLCANALLVAAAILLAGLRRVNARLERPFAYRHLLQIGYALWVAAVVLPFVVLLPTNEDFLPRTVQVWSASSMQAGARDAVVAHQIAVSLESGNASMSLSLAARIAFGVFISGLLVHTFKVTRDALATARIIASSQTLRRRGSLAVLVCDSVSVPFSFWIPGRYYIVIPPALILRPNELRMALRHEAQHHRQSDTKYLYLCQLARGLFYWNPAAHFLAKQVLELQEFACDEAVVARREDSVRDYCLCLLWVAEAATQRRRSDVQACMAGGNPGALVRRIEAALARPKRYSSRAALWMTGAAGVLMLATLSHSFAAPIQDRRISLAEAQQMVAVAQRDSVFPFTLNDRVLEQLNLLLGTPDGRAFLQASFARMAQYEDFISGQIALRGLPGELLAVPLVESGYRNLPPGRNARHGAGLWMFIERTARSMGLEVNGKVDQRLDVSAETDAALRMLTDLHAHFGDWQLALLAYNAGRQRVEHGMRETGSTDAWALTHQGYENDPGYLPRLMAAMLIVENREVLH